MFFIKAGQTPIASAVDSSDALIAVHQISKQDPSQVFQLVGLIGIGMLYQNGLRIG